MGAPSQQEPDLAVGVEGRERATGDVDAPGGPAFWIGLAVGGAVMAYAVWGAASAFSGDERRALVTWLLGGAVAHDAVLAPIVTVVGLLLAWLLPRTIKGPVLAALAISAIVVLFSWPALRGYGRREGNLSALPHDYGRNVVIVVALVWVVAALVVVVRSIRARR